MFEVSGPTTHRLSRNMNTFQMKRSGCNHVFLSCP